tara:strand:- start:15 stop:683 length:669 start_codon:yes stop_codon:yes gene_type:complete
MNLEEWVIVFDLDDTIISEREYQLSGITYIEKTISELYNTNFEGLIHSAKDKGIDDIWEWTCKKLNLSLDTKVTIKWLYRLHKPRIRLRDDINLLIKELEFKKAKIAIISDGRSITQRLKVQSIGLERFPLLISEDFNSVKPNSKRFNQIERIWPNKKYVYVADNPAKDFICPKSLNWFCIGANWITDRIYLSNKKLEPQPDKWLNDPHEVISTIENLRNSN